VIHLAHSTGSLKRDHPDSQLTRCLREISPDRLRAARTLSDQRTVYVSPADRDGFLAELRHLAPHAELDVKDSASIFG